MEEAGPPLGVRMGELRRFVRGIRNQVARSQRMESDTEKLMARALQSSSTSESGRYLSNNGFTLLSAGTGDLRFDAEFRARKPLPPENWRRFERIIENHVAFKLSRRDEHHVILIDVRKKTGVEQLILLAADKQDALMSQLLAVENLSDFAGLSSAKLCAKLGMFFMGVSVATAIRFNENMEVTQLHKRAKRISIPRTVTGEYAGHRFGMDTTFLGRSRNVDRDGELRDPAGENTATGEMSAVERKRLSAYKSSAKWWPKTKGLLSFAGFKFDNINEYASMIERGEQMRALCVAINLRKSVSSDDRSAMLSPFPYLVFDKEDVSPKSAAFKCRAMGVKDAIGDDTADTQTHAHRPYSPSCLLTCIDMYSRKAWVYPAPMTGTHHVLSSLALRYAMADANMDSAPPIITTDNGGEFHSIKRREDESASETAFGGVFNVHGIRIDGQTTVDPKWMDLATTDQKSRPVAQFNRRWKKGPPKLPKFTAEYKNVSQRTEVPSDIEQHPNQDTTGKYSHRKLSAANVRTLRRQMGDDIDSQPFFAYARTLGAHTITTTIPNYKKSGSQGPIESFHRTFKLMLAKETAMQASAIGNTKTVATDTWCMPAGDASRSPNVWCVTTSLIASTLTKYNNTYHASIGMTPQQLWDASRLLRAKEEGAVVDSKDVDRAAEMVAGAEKHVIHTRAQQPVAATPYEVGDWVRIHLAAPDRHMSKSDKDRRTAVYPDTFRKGYDWNWSSRIYCIESRTQVEGAMRLKRRGFKDYDFFTYKVELVKDPRYSRSKRDHEPLFASEGALSLQQEQLLRVDRAFLQTYPRLGRLFTRDGIGASNPIANPSCTFQRLLMEAGHEEAPVAADGDCQFAAVAIQAKRILGYDLDITTDSMRRGAVDQLQRFETVFLGFFDNVAYAGVLNHGLVDIPYNADSPEQHRESYARYTEAMSKPGAWGDNLTLLAMSRHLNIGIRVYRPAPGCKLDYNDVPDTQTVIAGTHPAVVITYNGVDHFNSTEHATKGLDKILREMRFEPTDENRAMLAHLNQNYQDSLTFPGRAQPPLTAPERAMTERLAQWHIQHDNLHNAPKKNPPKPTKKVQPRKRKTRITPPVDQPENVIQPQETPRTTRSNTKAKKKMQLLKTTTVRRRTRSNTKAPKDLDATESFAAQQRDVRELREPTVKRQRERRLKQKNKPR
jgi:hypothetical protein